LNSWYKSYNQWVTSKECKHQPGGITTFGKVVDQDAFYPCLWDFFATDEGKNTERNLVFTEAEVPEDRRITGFKQTVQIKQINQISVQGVAYLEDVRKIETEYGFEGTYSYSLEYLDFEQYVVFTEETTLSVGLSLVAVFFVILFVTGSLFVTILVGIAVLLVDYFLLALIYYWGLTFNSIVVINVVIALGLAVDYSAHIAHTYLTIEPPARCKTEQEKRAYKAKTAVSQMGSSVFHGGFSTFLAISVLGFSKSYVFEVFFKLWVGIIVFGMANGFFLLPIIFYYIGPTETHIESGHGNVTQNEDTISDRKGESMRADPVKVSGEGDKSENGKTAASKEDAPTVL